MNFIKKFVLYVGDTIQLIALATESAIKTSALAVVSGWGTERFKGSAPLFLRQVEVPLITNTLCNILYRGQVTDRMFCAGYLEGGKDGKLTYS